MNDLVRRLHVLNEETGDGKKKGGRGAGAAKLDDFSALKRGIAVQLKEIRTKIKKRNALMESQPGTKETVEASAAIRKALKDVKEDANTLDTMRRKAAKKAKSDEKKSEAQHRKEVCEMVFKHIEHCEALEKRRHNDRHEEARSTLFATSKGSGSGGGGSGSGSGAGMGFGGGATLDSDVSNMYGSGGGALGGSAMDEPSEAELQQHLQKFREDDEEIDRQLDILLRGVTEVKEIAVEMQHELRVQNTIIDDVTDKVDAATDKLNNLNKRLKMTITKVRKGDKFCLDLILVCVILGIVAFIYTKVA